jgi:hypothetical protein
MRFFCQSANLRLNPIGSKGSHRVRQEWGRNAKAQYSINLDIHARLRFPKELKKDIGNFVVRTEMAAQGGIRDKILRVSMSFETGKNSTRKANKEIPQKRRFTGTASYPWSVILKVHSWTAHLREGRVRSCAEIARREGITRARVSQLWPLGKITREQLDDALTASKGGEVSLRGLIRIARSPDMKTEGPEPENMASG